MVVRSTLDIVTVGAVGFLSPTGCLTCSTWMQVSAGRQEPRLVQLLAVVRPRSVETSSR